MIDTKELRDRAATFGSDYLTDEEWVEVIDRLEAAESAGLEQARLNGVGASREAAMMAKLEAAEKERDELRTELKEVRHGVAVANDTIKALRAKIEQMEQQFPVCRVKDIKRTRYMTKVVGLDHDAWLYLAPGAQPAPSVPEGWKLVPTAESRHPGIYKMLGALHAIDKTPGASEWESYAAFLAAAPEAKP